MHTRGRDVQEQERENVHHQGSYILCRLRSAGAVLPLLGDHKCKRMHACMAHRKQTQPYSNTNMNMTLLLILYNYIVREI